MGSTTTHGLPYPVGTDRVMDGDNAIQALAEAVDTAALSDTGWVFIPALAGFTSSAYYRIRAGLVSFRGSFSPASGNFTQAATSIVATLAVAARPPVNRQFAAATNWGGGLMLCRLDVQAGGNISVLINTGTTANTVWIDTVTYPTN